VISGALLRPLENQYPDQGIDGIPPAQAIVILGGNLHMPSFWHRGSGLIDASDRLLHALRLYRAGKAPLVVCSGGSRHNEEGESLGMGRLLEEWGVPSSALLLEDHSLSTRENALFSYRALQSKGIRRILLVTSAMHMPRAAGVFRKAGFEVVPAPADFRTGWTDGSTLEKWIPNAGSLSNSDKAIREWAGFLVYRLRGWI